MSTTPTAAEPGGEPDIRGSGDVPTPTPIREPGGRDGGSGSVMSTLQRFGLGSASSMRSGAMLVVFVVLAIYFNANSGGIFLTANNANLLIRQTSVLAVVAAGTTAIMVMGEIDLSIGSAIYLTGLLAAKADADWHVPLLAMIAITIAGGVVLGAFQGMCVAVLGMPSFIVTLGGLLAFRGIGEAWSGAASIAPVSNGFANLTEGAVSNLVTWVGVAVLGLAGLLAVGRNLMRRHSTDRLVTVARAAFQLLLLAAVIGVCIWLTTSIFGLPTAGIWIVGVGGILWLILSRTVPGRNAYLIGSNREASFRAGLPVRWTVFSGFIVSGVIYGLGGILLTARLDGSTSTAGTNYELFAIASAVLGGVSLRGGMGAVPGVIGGALLLSVIQNGMDLTSTSTFTQAIVEAAILLLAVALDILARRRAAAT
jgi:D-xylose transport system permease protein